MKTKQSVIITGASSGIGAALARQLAGEGAKVALAARRVELLEQVGRGVPQAGRRSAGGTMRRERRSAVQGAGRSSAWLHLAGWTCWWRTPDSPSSALLEDFPDLHLFKQVMDVNFYGAVYCTSHALPHLKRSHGRILAVSSLGGIAPLPYNSPYIASKYAMNGFYDTLRMEVRRHGVSVTVGCPYWVVTGFHEAQMDKEGVPRRGTGASSTPSA